MSADSIGSVLHVRALGTTVAIDAADEALVAPLERAWEAVLCEPADDGPRVRTPGPSGEGADRTTDELASTLSHITQEVTRAAIQARAGELFMFHAGALSDQASGATLAFVAPGGTGKTTLVRTLGPGRGYVTDETVGVRADRVIETYSKPLSVRRPSGGPKDETSPLALGLELPRVTPWLAGVVVLRRDLEPGEPVEVEEVDPLDALVMLGPETSSLARLDRPLHALSDLLHTIGGLRVVRYHDAADLDPLVSDVLAAVR
ncbi:hypothetical protein [Humibacillus xanthopallidus]|uniref:hypothetical protein n=1 Tax=Humibacillus xanthopallidus TaxID=412689 RepID=UPI00114FD997|nr:hypothetical protein [Humibacillus xanthopallidus]